MSLTLYKKKKERKCTNCGTFFQIFYRKDKSKKCCSVECQKQRKSVNKGKVIIPYQKCIFCNLELKNRVKKTKMHQDCYFKSIKKGRKKNNCLDCNAQLSDSYRVYCRSCSHKLEKNHNWKGGISNIVSRIRSTKSYKNWRTICFLRDNRTCVDCGYVGNKIQAHHINPLRNILANIKTFEEAMCKDGLFDTSNGVTLCVDCHYKISKNEDRHSDRYKLLLNNKSI